VGQSGPPTVSARKLDDGATLVEVRDGSTLSSSLLKFTWLGDALMVKSQVVV
jgi:hypothetical protein